MTLDPLGNIVLDSQADQEIIVVTDPGGSHQRALHVPLSYVANNGKVTSVETDDTAFASSSQGFLLFADKGLNTVYKLAEDAFAPGSAYTAADGGPFVGTLDFTSGRITPVVTGYPVRAAWFSSIAQHMTMTTTAIGHTRILTGKVIIARINAGNPSGLLGSNN